MNTTTTTVTPTFSSFFATKEDYLAFKAHWKLIANTKAITALDMALRILVLNQDALKAMPPTKNPSRLANGALQDSGLFKAMSLLNREARMAGQFIEKQKRPTQAPSPMSAFAASWEKHGIDINALASLEQKSNTSNFLGMR